MINKRNELGKVPVELGLKDAIHTAIASVRAGQRLQPGQKVTINEYGEAVPAEKKSVGVVDPFIKDDVIRGGIVWILLGQTEVPNVRHVWEHPEFDFAAPSRPVQRLQYIERIAEDLQIDYDQLLKDCKLSYEQNSSVKYTGKLSKEEFEEVMDSYVYDIWYEVEDELGLEYQNIGTECCPEYNLPILYYYECS